jgi:hypothetical protein
VCERERERASEYGHFTQMRRRRRRRRRRPDVT